MKPKSKRLLYLSGAILLICVTALTCYILFYPKQADNSLKYADNATTGIMPGIDMEKRKQELQDELDNSRIAFSINTSPVFSDGIAKGNLFIENPENNNKLLKVNILLNDTQEEIYSTDFIKPGSYIESDRLDKVLEKGSYTATAYFSAYEETSAEYIGQTGAEITLTIQN